MAHFAGPSVGVGGLLGSRALLGGQVAGLAAGRQQAERQRQQDFLNFFRTQQAQQQQSQFQQEQAFRQTMFERQGFQQQRQFGLAERQFAGLERFRTAQLGLRREEIGLRMLRAGGAGALSADKLLKLIVEADPSRPGGPSRLARLQLLARDRDPDIGEGPRLPGVLAGVETGIQEAFIEDPRDAPRRISEATPAQIQAQIRPPLGLFKRGFEAISTLSPFGGVQTGENIFRATTGFDEPTLRKDINELETFLAETRQRPKIFQQEQGERIRGAETTLKHLLNLRGLFERRAEFNLPSPFDLFRRQPTSPLDPEGSPFQFFPPGGP